MNQEEILTYLKNSERDRDLFRWADETRKRYCGEQVHVRGILNFSNFCVRSCLYCGLRKENKPLKRYRMNEDQIVQRSINIGLNGVKTVVLQSGDDPFYARDKLSRIICRIKKKIDITVTLSIGERTRDEYKAFRFAGAERYLLKFETSNPDLYERLHPGQSYARRIKLLELLEMEGYRVGTGNIVGLPGQTLEDLCRDILLIKDLSPYMVAVGPFLSQKETPLAKAPKVEKILALKVLALTRLSSPLSHIPATSALGSLDHENGYSLGLKAGANVIMPDFTPPDYREHYRIYDNRVHLHLDAARKTITNLRKESPFSYDSFEVR